MQSKAQAAPSHPEGTSLPLARHGTEVIASVFVHQGCDSAPFPPLQQNCCPVSELFSSSCPVLSCLGSSPAAMWAAVPAAPAGDHVSVCLLLIRSQATDTRTPAVNYDIKISIGLIIGFVCFLQTDAPLFVEPVLCIR